MDKGSNQVTEGGKVSTYFERLQKLRNAVDTDLYHQGRWSTLCNGFNCYRDEPLVPYGKCKRHNRSWNTRRKFYRLPFHLILALFDGADSKKNVEFNFNDSLPEMYSWSK